MLKRYLQKWLGIYSLQGRADWLDIQAERMASAIYDLRLTKQDKPQNRKPPVRKAAKKRGKV